MKTISALCVAPRSIYKSFEQVECFDRRRNVVTFTSNTPIVAHPPCRAWSRFTRQQAKPEPGEKDLGPLCVGFLRECGGVLEHPAHSHLWEHCKLPYPNESKGSLWCMEVHQAWWGHPLRKKTWLLFNRIPKEIVEIPFLLHHGGNDRRRQQVMSKAQRSATPPDFAQWLVNLARQVDGDSKSGLGRQCLLTNQMQSVGAD